MIETRPTISSKTIGFRPSGKLHDEDYKSFIAIVESFLAAEGKARLFVQLEDFHGADFPNGGHRGGEVEQVLFGQAPSVSVATRHFSTGIHRTKRAIRKGMALLDVGCFHEVYLRRRQA